ncbi:MAG: apolipoprotein N-acyltransferase [Gammaproteobacteria bacterium]|nr:apolipoprotein N-acyltransferase [Gammaproteobacteria bacterium]
MSLTRRSPRWLGSLLALGAGLLLPFAFAPYGAWWVAPLSLAALFLSWHAATPRLAALRGYLFGAGFFGHGVAWVQISIHQFGLPLYSFSVSMTALFALYLALYPALTGWLVRRLPATGELTRLAVLAPALWTLVEWSRGWLFSGFPWLVLGDSQTDSPLRGWLPILGASGTTLLLVTMAAAGCVAGLGRSWGRAGLCVLAAALPVLVGRALVPLEWTQANGPPQSVALVQGAVPQEIKWLPATRATTLARYAALTEPHWGTDIIVWPETALPAFPQEISDYLQQLARRAEDSHSLFLLGLPTSENAERYFNSVLLLGPHEGRYSKHHLVPFGEYLPYDRQLRPLLDFLSIPMSSFTPGAPRQPVLQTGTLKLGVTICYEDAFASEVSKALPDANLLVNVSNDAWFGDSAAPHQHLQIARVRALESGRDLLRATNTGISALIDHRGQVLARSPQFTPVVVTGTTQPRAGMTPFTRYGPWPSLLLAVALVLSVSLRGRRVPPRS